MGTNSMANRRRLYVETGRRKASFWQTNRKGRAMIHFDLGRK